MVAYTEIINEFISDFTYDNEAIAEVVKDTAEKYRGEYHDIADVDPDSFDNGTVQDFLDEVKREIAYCLKAEQLI